MKQHRKTSFGTTQRTWLAEEGEAAACEAAGLDAEVGVLHGDRPGRSGMARDLVEEFCTFLADRLALSLINRRQVKASGFRVVESGGIRMDHATRKTVRVAYQNPKQE